MLLIVIKHLPVELSQSLTGWDHAWVHAQHFEGALLLFAGGMDNCMNK